MKTRITNWQILKLFLIDRIKKPIHHPSFVFYFITIIFLIGSIGFLYDIVTSFKSCEFEIAKISTNASNIFISLIAASAVELILINESDLEHPYRKNDVQIVGISFLIFGFLLWMLAISFKDNCFGLIVSIIGLLLSYLFWWISNSGNKILVPDDKPDIALGGGTGSDSGIGGDVSGFKTK